MIIQCDQCDRKFRVDDAKIKPPGSRVRCSKCGNVFFVEKKETTKSQEKVHSSNLDNLQLDDKGKIGQERGYVEDKVKETQEEVSTISSHAEIDKAKNETVWSIDQDEESPSQDFEKPSIKVDLKSQDTTDIQPANANVEAQPDNKESKSDSSISWASLDNEKKDQSLNIQTESDDDLTPPVQTEPTSETKEPETVETQPESSHTTPQSNTKETPEEPKLDLGINKANEVDRQTFQSSQPNEDIFSSNLSVDRQILSEMQAGFHSNTPVDQNGSGYDTHVTKSTYKPRRKSVGSKIGSFIGKIIVVLSILVIIGSVGLIIAVNLEILPKEKTRELRDFLVSNLPINIKDPLANIDITQTHGQWINSSNGPLFIVQGTITNFSDNIVNYIQLKSEFINNGQVVYDPNIYAGNTFTNKELQSLPLNDIINKLNRKNGDIDFSDPRKLAGKNYNIMPGESIKFYSVFPSKSQILGLKYNVEIVDADIILIEDSE